jgi:hypothetical protein
MLISADQLLCHIIGDYVLQSDYMAQNKTNKSWIAMFHAFSYSIPFWFVASWRAQVFIIISHFVIDRWRLARYVCWAKNFLAPKHIMLECNIGSSIAKYKKSDEKAKITFIDVETVKSVKTRNLPWADCSVTGYSKDTPVWMAVWLMIIVDNCMHTLCNALAIKYL